MVAVKDRLNALKNPYAHLKLEDISLETVKASPMMWDPVRFLESCPSSDGACAVVFTDEAGGERGRGRRPSAGVDPRHRRCARSRRRSPAATRCARRARSTARPTSTRRPASPTRSSRSTAPSSTCRSAGTSRCGSRPTTSPSRQRGLEDGRARRHRARRLVPGEHVGRRAVVEPDRRVGPAALRRGGAAGAGHGRRAPGRRGEGRARPGVRRVGAVLLDVGRRELASTRSPTDRRPHPTRGGDQPLAAARACNDGRS